jgi:hypothetical protein
MGVSVSACLDIRLFARRLSIPRLSKVDNGLGYGNILETACNNLTCPFLVLPSN